MKLIEKKFDPGDIIGVEGHLFRTNKGELTLFAKTKTLLPFADKHTGPVDKELRYRKRWLDLLSNDDVAHRFKLRTRSSALCRTSSSGIAMIAPVKGIGTQIVRHGRCLMINCSNNQP